MAPSQHSPERYENGVSPSGTGKPGKRYCSKPRSTEHDAASSTDVAIPSRHARAVAASNDARERRQLLARLEVRLAVGPAQVGERIERPAVLDRGQHVVHLAVVGRGVVDVVGDDDRQAELGREGRRFRHEPVVVGQEVVRELDEEAARGRPVAAPEQRRVALRDRPCPGPIADPQSTRDLPVATARQRDEPFVMLVEEGLAEPRHALGPGQVRARHEPRQAAPADRRAGEQHEMRSARPRADPAQVLLDRIAMPGEARALGAWPRWTAFRHDRFGGRGGRWRGSTAPALTPGRDDDTGRIGDGGIEQLDLRPDDAVEADLLGRAHESDRAVQAVAVGDGQPGQPDRRGPLDQLVRWRGPIEEREIGVGVELGVGDGGHVISGRGPACRGPASIEQTF